MEMMTMEMYFYWGTDVVFLLESWTIKSNTGLYCVALAASFLCAVLLEFLNTRKLDSKPLFALVTSVKLWLSYLLMLVLMTFNAGLFIVVMLGYTLGYFLFGFAPMTFHKSGSLTVGVNGVNTKNDLF
jgi:copper transporter 1